MTKKPFAFGCILDLFAFLSKRKLHILTCNQPCRFLTLHGTTFHFPQKPDKPRNGGSIIADEWRGLKGAWNSYAASLTWLLFYVMWHWHNCAQQKGSSWHLPSFHERTLLVVHFPVRVITSIISSMPLSNWVCICQDSGQLLLVFSEAICFSWAIVLALEITGQAGWLAVFNSVWGIIPILLFKFKCTGSPLE